MTNLAQEAGMSRKQLYHYFRTAPAVADRWQELATSSRADRRVDARRLKHELSDLQNALGAWQAVAAIARAEAEHLTEQVKALRAENERLRATTIGSFARNIVPLTCATSAER
jgi:hypothetical protein